VSGVIKAALLVSLLHQIIILLINVLNVQPTSFSKAKSVSAKKTFSFIKTFATPAALKELSQKEKSAYPVQKGAFLASAKPRANFAHQDIILKMITCATAITAYSL
jgi:hypothetical protein